MTGSTAEQQASRRFEEDFRLAQLVANGDERAQRMLAMRVAGRGLAIIKAMVKSEADAKDVLQDGLLELFKAAPSYRGDAPIEAWADRIIVRRSVRYISRTVKKREAREVLVDSQELVGNSLATTRLQDDSIAAIVDTLDPEGRQLVRLRFVMGYTVNEIADLTDAPLSTTKKKLLRAIASMRNALRRDLEGRDVEDCQQGPELEGEA